MGGQDRQRRQPIVSSALSSCKKSPSVGRSVGFFVPRLLSREACDYRRGKCAITVAGSVRLPSREARDYRRGKCAVTVAGSARLPSREVCDYRRGKCASLSTPSSITVGIRDDLMGNKVKETKGTYKKTKPPGWRRHQSIGG